MKNSFFFRWLLFLPLFYLTACEKKAPDPATPTPPTTPTTPVPVGARTLRLVVEPGYDFSDTKAYSAVDSLSMDKAEKRLSVTKDKDATIILLNRTSGEVMGVVRVDAMQQEVVVNATSVAKALFDLIPAYSSLTGAQKETFEREVLATPAYAAFSATVKDMLTRKQPLYSTDPTFITQLRALNRYILVSHLGDPLPVGSSGRRGSSDTDFTKWINNEGGAATLTNQVHSYMKATFVPADAGASKTFMLEPDPVLPGLWSKQGLAAVLDNCYTLRLNQSDSDVKQKNVVALTTKMLGAALGNLHDYLGGVCLETITLTIANEIGPRIAGLANGNTVSTTDILKETVKMVGKSLFDAVKKTECQTAIIKNNKFLLAKLSEALIKKTNVILALLDGADKLYDFVETVPYVLAVSSPLDLSEKMQIYYGKHLPACVKVIKSGTLLSSYAPGAVVNPTIAMIAKSEYASWEKAGFKVTWSVMPGHGTLQLGTTQTSNTGKSTAQWTLPKEEGTYILVAEVKDREGELLEGSPLRFDAKVIANTCVNASLPTVQKLIAGGATQRWRLITMNIDGQNQPRYPCDGSEIQFRADGTSTQKYNKMINDKCTDEINQRTYCATATTVNFEVLDNGLGNAFTYEFVGQNLVLRYDEKGSKYIETFEPL